MKVLNFVDELNNKNRALREALPDQNENQGIQNDYNFYSCAVVCKRTMYNIIVEKLIKNSLYKTLTKKFTVNYAERFTTYFI